MPSRHDQQEAKSGDTLRPLRLVIQQPALPKYRIPVFQELARRPGIQTTIVYGLTPGLPNLEPDGFDGRFIPLLQRRVRGRPIYWHRAQIAYATRKSTDVLVLSWDVHYASLVPAILRAKANGVPVILWGHGYSKHEAFYRRMAREKVADLATALLFYNRSTARYFVESGWDPQRIFVAANSLDQGPIQAARRWWLDRPEALAAFRREQELGDGPIILFVSRLEAGRNIEVLLEAIAGLAGHYPGLKSVIVGGGAYRQALADMAKALGVADRVRLVGPVYDEAKLAPWFLSSTLFGFPSYMGLSLLHAFGYGLPVVTSDRVEGHGPEIEALRHGENGLLFADGDATAMANAMRAIIDDPATARRMSAEALRTATEEYNVGRMVDGFEAAARYCGEQVGVHVPGPAPTGVSPGELGGTLADTAGLAIVSNAHAPYRIHLHQRVAREIPEVRLWSVFTHEVAYAPWSFRIPSEIRPVLFGRNEHVDRQTNPLYAVREWVKGGRIIRWMRSQDIRAVVVLGYNDLGRLRVIRWCHRNGIPCWVWGDSNIRNEHVRGIKRLLKPLLVGRLLRWCTGALACGSGGREYFEKYGVPPERVFLFPLEPDYELIRGVSPMAISAARTRWGLADGRRRIVFSGRLVGLKRVDLLIDAFAAIAVRRPEWDLVIVGDGPLRRPLEQRVAAELRPRVIWTGFLGDQADISAIYRASDVLVLPSEKEAWALVINEAAAANMAIVSSSVPGAAAELVRDGVNGRIFPSADLGALTESLLDVTDPARIDTMKSASADVLADWRRRGDPVEGLRRALQFAGVLAKN